MTLPPHLTRLFPAAILAAGLVVPLQALTLHVDAGASGTGDGSSWANAYPDLQSALAVATSGDELWVAAGTYLPDAGPSQTPADRTSTFLLPDGVAVYGGFAGNELAREDRNPAQHVTILSGDLLQNNELSGSTLDDAYHVVTVNGAGPSTILDGLTITAGHASGSAPDNAGGAVLCIGGSSPTIRHCLFAGNLAEDLGGAVHIDGGSAPTFTNCAFSGNRTSYLGGAACITNASTATFSHCTFAENGAPGLSGYGGAIYTSPSSTVELLNSILWDNAATTAGDQVEGPVTPASTSNLLQGSSVGGAVVTNSDPLFVRNPSPGPDGDWSGPADNDYGDLDLQSTSPARDVGDNALLSSGLDLANRSRLQNGTTDLGAYEVPLLLTVSSLDDAGFGTLRGLVSGLPSPGGATIRFAPNLDGQSIQLTGGPLQLDRDVVIDGSGLPDGITLDAGQASRVAEVFPDREVVISDLTITGGRSADGTPGTPGTDNPGNPGGPGGDGTPGEDGGAILNHGTLTLARVTLHGNTTGAGGNGGDGGSGSTVGAAGAGARSGRGGAIANEGTLTLINSTLANNATGPGGNAGSGGGTPVAGSGGDGGGIYNSGTLVLLQATLTTNAIGAAGTGTAPSPGTGGGLRQDGVLTISNSVLSENVAPGSGPDLAGAVDTATGLNFVGDPDGASGLGSSLRSGASLLGPLADNGGPTLTCRPAFDSPLVDPAGGDTASRFSVDQRGLDRVTTGVVDIGAVEALLSLIVTTSDDAGDGSLRNAIESLESGGVITFDPALDGSTIPLTGGALELNKSVRIDASALPSGVTVDGTSSSRSFTIHDGNDGDFQEVVLANLTIANGSTIGNGGAISSREHLSLHDCHIHSNQSAGAGGAIWFAIGTTTIERCTFTGNTAAGSGGGGALRLEAPATVTVTDSTFSANGTTDTSPSSRGGGAVSTAAGAKLTMSGSSLEANTSDSFGGALSIQSGQPTLSDLVFSRNAAAEGGAVHLQSGLPSLLRCQFVENSASVRGGAVSMTSGATPTIANSSFTGNAAPEGGAVAHDLSSPGYVNCAFIGNEATTGGAAHSTGSSTPAFTNCSLTANAAQEGGGLYSNVATPVLTHAIVWNNSATVTNPNISGSVDAASSGNLIEGGSGPHVISTADPVFARDPGPGPDGDWSGFADNDYGDLRLIAGSPALDAGSNAAYDAISTVDSDLRGQPRQVGAIDLGAIEGTFENFAALHPGLDPTADENGNGWSNFVDYASGLDPAAPHDPSVAPSLSGSTLAFSHRPNPAVDTFPSYEMSADLEAWTGLEEGSDYTILSSATNGTRTTVTLQLLTTPGPEVYFRQRFGPAP